MARDLSNHSRTYRELIAVASEELSEDISAIGIRGNWEQLTRSRYVQPLMVCVSLGYFRQFTEMDFKPGVVLGHSLGELAALAAAGVVTDEDAVRMATRRGILMEEAAEQYPGGMLAVSSPEIGIVQEWVGERYPDRSLIVANVNAPDQIVLSGSQSALEEAREHLKANNNCRTSRLRVAGPWHSPFMTQAASAFADWIQMIEFRPPQLGLITNMHGQATSDPLSLQCNIARSIAAPVQWMACMDELKKRAPDSIFEIGPGRVLAGMARANGFGAAVDIRSVSSSQAIRRIMGRE